MPSTRNVTVNLLIRHGRPRQSGWRVLSRHGRQLLTLLGLAVAGGLELAMAFLAGARILSTPESVVLIVLPVAAMVAIAASTGWAARIDRLCQPPPAQVRWDELIRRPAPGAYQPAGGDAA